MMKATFTIIVLIFTLSGCTQPDPAHSAISSGQQQSQSWIGEYSYEIAGPISYSLIIKPDNTCVYEGVGIQTFFQLSCKGKLNATKYEIFWVKTIDGAFAAEEWMDKSKPIMTLFYKNNILYTDEGQLNEEIKGGQLLFKKTK